MNLRKIGGIIIILSFVLGIFLFYVIGLLEGVAAENNCMETKPCMKIQESMNYSHIFIGIITSLFSLGVYMTLFHKGEEAVLKRIEETKQERDSDEQFNVILQFLDIAQQNVLSTIRVEPGITQSTLALRTNLSKAKISQIIQSFEKKDIIQRKPKGKTYQIFLKKAL